MSAIPAFPPPGASIDTRRWAWLPPVGTWGYYTLLAAIGMLILGPLGGIAAAFMNFSIGFYVGGQVLAGILGSVVTYGYGAEGKHGANYIQTTAASVAGMMAMSTLIQAMAWMGMPEVPAWQLVTYMLCIGMMAAGIGMLYTPILVERMQLTFPSGLAVANILRALTDPVLLKQSVSRLFGGMGAGLIGGIGAAKIAVLGAIELSTSTFGAGLIVGARVGIPAIVGGGIFWALAPYFVSIGWLKEGEPFRKIAFLIALGMILGAAVVDLSLIFWRVARRLTQPGERVVVPEEQRTGPRASLPRLLAWVGVWTVATIVCGVQFFNEPLGYMILAVALVYLFVIVNGISLGLTDSNPISSAFVVTVLILASIGLKDPMLGLLAAMVVFVSASVAGDMQQDRSTGWRLGSNRTLQFRFQVAGLLLGSVLAVAVAKFFMTAYPVLQLDQTVMSADQAPAQWTSAMTYKFVGALRSLTEPKPYQTQAILIGVLIGFATELLRKIIKANKSYQRFAAGSKAGFATDFMLDAVVLPSPYASSFGGFVNLHTSMWFAAGGVISSAINTLAPKPKPGENELPSDMSSTSLVGGGLIAGDALAALGLGLAGMAAVLG
ncbi:OPT/YSL family transporter [Paucibacter sp. DJ1R-11]|uniref:OPT/YSL family transporter n=1 Tax=Paucibacter sp. DJ1R-11 TaxID=2893556 RepID=UPI0021E4819A|nr:OPT/YSL family transporter [Paucibacter sp. DJ1R-11]MCV2362896.1 OPT/YSL family transporter [Paucibacter sp. DJ1R-11]